MLQRRVAMDAVAIHAALLRAAFQHIPRIGIHMAVGGVKSGVIGALEIDLEVGKQIVANDEIIGVGQTAGLRASAAEMTLAAGGNDLPRIARPFRPQQSQLRVGGVLLLDISMAGIAIKSKSRKRVRFRIDAGRMASGALGSEDIGLPGLAIAWQD